MSNQTTFSWEAFEAAPVVGILRGVTVDTLNRIIPVYQKAGFSTIEITMNTEGATDLIAQLRDEYPSLNVGAGTVCSMDDLEKALMAGAQFIVTPILNEEVIIKCKEIGVPSFVGALTPTEIYNAWTLGAAAVKVFPCSQFGVGYIKDVLAPLNTIKLLPTGGVTKDNIADFFKVGAIGVGMGGSLFPKPLMEEGKEEELMHYLISLKKEIPTATILS
ncbi:bifunctional 4-hydroxy-2-oxoglutarate aldolase/2-dehydro-3-deoxy-phosphogluconate aldolase [Flammeovirga sp. SubArs3]|uniref:bifunctional 4-hydroxy-2-oxoglutarate aldolase/2-dehydro-3-deoxy-phosphogluconate aldolase n=1 Tax=Flammeovirga sp. SubArs3 TaxID=2995316 RepID=UPI00248C9C70|nr:bifunctional 4-hydroxy-2-oxoglutarate aldolase/2-dehydro-3-deoxy-phosphogluconate aldolase [Flammeovirga sp. SubArs3]